jgi:hypothetical protein
MPSPQASKKAAASVNSRMSWNAMERGLFKDDDEDALASFENVADAANRVDEFRLERVVYFGA